MNPKVLDLINQLEQLRLQESDIIEQLRQVTGAPETTEATVATTPHREGDIKVGDRVRFKATRTTKGGTGTVVGFTGGQRSFLRIKRDNGRFEVTRKPHNVELIKV
jgi:hypothetical protein